MVDIIAVLQCLDQCLSKTTLRQLERIIPAMLAMTGRVTMLGIARWTGQGGSYRTVQRFFNTVIAWSQVQWFFIRHHLLDPAELSLPFDGNILFEDLEELNQFVDPADPVARIASLQAMSVN